MKIQEKVPVPPNMLSNGVMVLVRDITIVIQVIAPVSLHDLLIY